MEQTNVLFAFIATLAAGLSTGVGSTIAFFARKTNTRFLAFALGFSAGVMLYVSFVEIIAKSKTALIGALGNAGGNWTTVAGFFGGIVLIGLIDRLVPSIENPHEMHDAQEMEQTSLDRTMREPEEKQKYQKLLRTGLFTALAIAIHNFPEGLATFAAALQSKGLGVSIAVAIAIHNIPEGIAVSVPIYYATGNRKRAFVLSFLSGLSEPLGALIGYLILRTVFTPVVFGVVFSAVAGIMVYISLDELLPSAEKYGDHHLTIYGLILGMAVMAFSLLMFI